MLSYARALHDTLSVSIFKPLWLPGASHVREVARKDLNYWARQFGSNWLGDSIIDGMTYEDIIVSMYV